MKRYRDLSVAHHDPRRVEIKNYPTFDLALEFAYFYYDFVVSELSKHGIDQQPKDLRGYARDFGAQCNGIARAAIEGTRRLKSECTEPNCD